MAVHGVWEAPGRCKGADLLSEIARSELRNDGFTVLRDAVAPERLPQIVAAYDAAMEDATGPELKVGSATTRLSGFADRGVEFDHVYVWPPLLEACRQVVGQAFRLSSFMGRTLREKTAAQDLHVDIARQSPELPMAGFILMLDEFRAENGATRFVPGSHRWVEAPDGTMRDRKRAYPNEVLACGPAGSMVVFDASIWHGHTANVSDAPRRSLKGYFVRRVVRSLVEAGRVCPQTLARVGPLARYVLGVEEAFPGSVLAGRNTASPLWAQMARLRSRGQMFVLSRETLGRRERSNGNGALHN